ncbi:hypothetical protein SAMN05192583_3320 [Sphingomonas gellani]|uniref:DUF3325 domain-containing protein n=1 Tax=Sphingomonas gellani TaxID=1166340 RepID=A0A1H8ILJ8_9SPHN|nr:hypothetical protein [Sphingomonas gellani]SEN69005.1 hypothetical protein SAMN05192583_3320 [Sphingomonas gellani]
MIVAWLAAGTTLAGAVAVYLAAPHQALTTGHVTHRRAWRRAGGAALTLALVLLLTVQGSATAVFTWMTGVMLVWTVVPVVARWWHYRGERP